MVALLVLAGAQAHAIGVGDKVAGRLDIGGKQVPLPTGEWVITGLGTEALDMPALGAFGTIQSAVLLLSRGNAIVSVLEIRTNTISVNDGWGRTKACSPDPAQLLLINRYLTGWETSCQFVRPMRFGLDTAGPEVWDRTRDYAGKAGLAAPELWLTAGFRVSDRQDIIDVRYHISPALLLGPSALNLTQVEEWSAQAVKEDPLRQGAVQAVSAWASGFDAWVERGLRNQITQPPGALPGLATRTSTYADAKLLDLRRLLDAELISKASYDRQVEMAKAEAPEYKANDSLLSNSVKKNISFRSFGTFVDYGIAYIVTASNVVSWGIALTLNATDSLWFVLNDQYWDDHYAKLNKRDSDRIVDFTYIGWKVGM